VVAKLLSALLRAVDSEGMAGSPLMSVAVELFENSVIPYLTMLDEFLDTGRTSDPGREFMVSQRRLHPSNRFWDEALIPAVGPGNGGEAPRFLRECANEILLTGKALALIFTVRVAALHDPSTNAEFEEASPTEIEQTNRMGTRTSGLTEVPISTVVDSLDEGAEVQVRDLLTRALVEAGLGEDRPRTAAQEKMVTEDRKGANKRTHSRATRNVQQMEQTFIEPRSMLSVANERTSPALAELIARTTVAIAPNKALSSKSSSGDISHIHTSSSAKALLGRHVPLSGKEMRPPQVANLYKSLELQIAHAMTRHVLKRRMVVGKRLYEVLEDNQPSLSTQLHALRSFFLMASGEVARVLQESLFPRLASRQWPHKQGLQVMVENALRMDPDCECALDGKLRVEANLRPPQCGSGGPEAMAWIDTLKFECVVPWHLGLVVTSESMNAYFETFRFLLKVQYSKWAIDQLTLLGPLRNKAVRRFEGKEGKLMGQFYMLRAKMRHILGSFTKYMVGRAVNGAWSGFVKRLASLHESCDLSRIRAEHGMYLAEVKRQTLLADNFKAAKRKVLDLLKVGLELPPIGKLIATVALGDGGIDNGRFASGIIGMITPDVEHILHNVSRRHKAVNEHVRFLLVVLKEVLSHGVQQHLQELLNSLDYNHYFSDTPGSRGVRRTKETSSKGWNRNRRGNVGRGANANSRTLYSRTTL